eukprot:1140076-Pelagomonas_calceolata.AAC.2
MKASGKGHWRVKEEDRRTKKHIVAEENRLEVYRFENNMLFVLHVILGITKVTGRRNVANPT